MKSQLLYEMKKAIEKCFTSEVIEIPVSRCRRKKTRFEKIEVGSIIQVKNINAKKCCILTLVCGREILIEWSYRNLLAHKELSERARHILERELLVMHGSVVNFARIVLLSIVCKSQEEFCRITVAEGYTMGPVQSKQLWTITKEQLRSFLHR